MPTGTGRSTRIYATEAFFLQRQASRLQWDVRSAPKATPAPRQVPETIAAITCISSGKTQAVEAVRPLVLLSPTRPIRSSAPPTHPATAERAATSCRKGLGPPRKIPPRRSDVRAVAFSLHHASARRAPCPLPILIVHPHQELAISAVHQ